METNCSLRRAILFSKVLPAPNPPSSTLPILKAHDALRSMPSEEVAMEHQFFIRQQNLKLYRGLVAASGAAAAKADARQEKLLKLLAEEVANEPPPRKN
jgi:hypothetical protein